MISYRILWFYKYIKQGIKMTKNYREIWEENFGKIPKDQNGRSYEIHHIDGNHTNNNIENLKCITIDEHYKIHYDQGDFGACVMIAKRMNLPPDHISKIQTGVKRPGVGGVKKGTIPWNKGSNGYKLNISEEGKDRKILAVKSRSKIQDHDAESIRIDYKNKVSIDNVDIGKIKGNGKVFSYERAFSKEYAKKYSVTEQYIFRIITGKSKNV